MISISLCMIVKNEDASLENCLESIHGAVDEIIIVDTGSKDNTLEIAKKYTESIYEFQWTDDFSAARNYSFSKAKCDYILWLDADDIFLKEDLEKLINLKNNFDESIDCVAMQYDAIFNEDGSSALSTIRFSLVKNKRNCNFSWIGRVHEYLNVSGEILYSDIKIMHKKIKSHNDYIIKIYESMLLNREKLSERDYLYYANELYAEKIYKEAEKYYNIFLKISSNNLDKIFVHCQLSDYYCIEGNFQKAVGCLKKIFSFTKSLPPEALCRLGFSYLNLNKIDKAIQYYKTAIDASDTPLNNFRYINEPCRTWLPCLQLCICYSIKKDYREAQKWNDKAYIHNSNNPNILYNRKWLAEHVI